MYKNPNSNFYNRVHADIQFINREKTRAQRLAAQVVKLF